MQVKTVAVLLAVMLAGSEASKLAFLNPHLLQAGKIDRLGDTAIINQYVETTIPMMVEFIKERNLDPMDLPDLQEGFSYKPLLVTYSAMLYLTNGKLTNLVSVYRNNDAVVSYFAQMLRLRLELGFNDLEFVYDYSTKVMNIGPTGKARGSLSHLNVVVDVLFDFNNDEIHLQRFALTEIGHLRVRLSGNFLTDWFVNPVIALFASLFDSVIIGVVEHQMRNEINAGIENLNTLIRETIASIEY